MKFHQKAIKPEAHFDLAVVKQTYSFLKTLSTEEIIKYRRSYKRELNTHMDDTKNALPPHTVEKRRCFLYITQNYADDNLLK